jgi:hypothetical protein
MKVDGRGSLGQKKFVAKRPDLVNIYADDIGL